MPHETTVLPKKLTGINPGSNSKSSQEFNSVDPTRLTRQDVENNKKCESAEDKQALPLMHLHVWNALVLELAKVLEDPKEGGEKPWKAEAERRHPECLEAFQVLHSFAFSFEVQAFRYAGPH